MNAAAQGVRRHLSPARAASDLLPVEEALPAADPGEEVEIIRFRDCPGY